VLCSLICLHQLQLLREREPGRESSDPSKLDETRFLL
jgi:hypothetical protein